MAADYDLAITGSGFGGSLMALVARRLGKSVVLLERHQHPRFAIGESSTPLANLLLEELAVRYDLPRLLPLTKWGRWQQHYPKLACGLKRGFSFFHHQRGQPWKPRSDRGNELLVGASPHDAIADTHWFRAEFDQFLVDEAINEGVEYIDLANLESVEFAGDIINLRGSRQGRPLEVRSRFLIDASGPNGFLQKHLSLPQSAFAVMPPTQGLFTHFTDVREFAELHGTSGTPFPIDQAALHHVFENGWIWVLRFNNGITSAGVAADDRLANEIDFRGGEKAWHRLLQLFPSIDAQFASARLVRPFTHVPRLSARTNRVVGPGWALLPHTAGFVDPLLSTGFPLNLLGIKRLAGWLEDGERDVDLQDYETATLAELDITSQLVGSLYAQMHDFEVFTSLTQLYFAAASYSETMRRLGRPRQSFLLLDESRFGPGLRQITEIATRKSLDDRARSDLLQRITELIEPFNLAGLNDPARRNWYPVLASDLINASSKTGASPAEITEMLVNSGFYPAR